MCYIKIYKFYNLGAYTERTNSNEIILVLKYKLLQFMLVKKSSQFKIVSGKNILITIIFLTKKINSKRDLILKLRNEFMNSRRIITNLSGKLYFLCAI